MIRRLAAGVLAFVALAAILASHHAHGQITPYPVGPYVPGTYTVNGVILGNGPNSLQVTAAPTANQVLIGNSGAPFFTTLPSCSAGSSALTYNTGTQAFGCNTITSGTALSAITAATVANSIESGDKDQEWEWAQTTDATIAMSFAESAAATGGTSTGNIPNQVLLQTGTLAASTASPFVIFNRGAFVLGIDPATGKMVSDGGLWSRGAITTGILFNGSPAVEVVGSNTLMALFGSAAGNNSIQVGQAGSATLPTLTDQQNANIGVNWFGGSHTMSVADTTSGEVFRWVGGNANSAYVTLTKATTFANLPAAANGSLIYCSDCDPASAIDQTCTHAGAQTGAMAARVNGAWKCYS